jgi:hypothetical protein
VTPTFITTEADLGILPSVTPLPATTTPEGPTMTPTLAEFPTVPPLIQLPATLEFAPQAPTLVTINPQTRAFALSTSGGGFTSGGFSLLGDATLFERNPADPSQYAVTNSAGSLFVTGVGGVGAQRITVSPFSVFEPLSRAENNAFVADLAWSPNGRYLAFLVDADQLASDGVWFFQPGQTDPNQLLVDCHAPGFPGCEIVSNPIDPDLWESRQIVWSPSNDAILALVNIPSEGRNGLIILPVSFNRVRDTRPPVLRYEFGSWERNGNRVLVSGSSPDGSVFVAWLNRDGSLSQMVFDARSFGLWMGYANQSSDGQIYALGAPGGPGGGLSIYNMQGQALTGTIGGGQPQRVEWSPDGRAVYVEAGGRQYVAFVSGEVRDITGSVGGAQAVNWVDGLLPPSEETGSSGSAAIPSGVIAGSLYEPGQQLRVYSAELNVRAGPGYSYDFARNFLVAGEYVRILAGPVEAEGATWWQIQTNDGSIGWIAGEVNGAPTIGP